MVTQHVTGVQAIIFDGLIFNLKVVFEIQLYFYLELSSH